jgi:hypothetical protein
MARVIEDGQSTPVVVEYVGSRFDVWRVERDQREYSVFCNHRGGLSITFAGEDADELEEDLQALSAGHLIEEALEDRLAAKIDPFLASIGH